MRRFQLIALTPLGTIDPSIAIAASRAGELGVLNLEHIRDASAARDAILRMTHSARRACGIRVEAAAPTFVDQVTRDVPESVEVVVLIPGESNGLHQQVADLREHGLKVLLEVTCLEQGYLAEELGVDGLVAKGNEAGGWVGEETTFILLQRLLSHVQLPVWPQGGIGLHTAASCYAAGAAGVVLDSQLALTRESQLPKATKATIFTMDGSETACLGRELDQLCRVYARPGLSQAEELREVAIGLARDARPRAEVVVDWRQAIAARMGWGDAREQVWPLGQDAAFAASLAERYHTVAGVLHAIRESVSTHVQSAQELRPLDEGSPLARSHSTTYPIVQGPMARVSDRAQFALRVAEGGALPFLALAQLRAPEIESLLDETRRLLDGRPWGVGILGFVPTDLRQEQVEAIRRYRPPFALIAGGRPDQARALQEEGIVTYLHVPSPGLLRLFLQDGARRFVFEGREAGGHIGPRSSFILWDTMIDVLAEHLPASEAADCHVLFAGGIHDALSASMVATAAAPLAKLGVRVGLLLGTSYVFTQEALATGAILPGFQKEALRCQRTVILESAPGHAIRCAPTPYADLFQQEKERQVQEGKSPDEIRQMLDGMNLGRLRMAAKGISRHPRYGQDPGVPKLVSVGEEEQRNQGTYMLGELATLRDCTCTIAELHQEISAEGSRRLEHLPTTTEPASLQMPAAQPSQVAIVGISAILPGAKNLQEYWENILNEVYAIKEIPKERWPVELYYDPDRNARDKVYSKWGGFIEDVAFDPVEFGMPPSSLPSIDPIHLLALVAAREAVADAGYAERPFDHGRTSVILGASGGVGEQGAAYVLRSSLPLLFGEAAPNIVAEAGELLPEWTEDSFAGLLLNVVAGRIANRFDFGGENYVVDAACASSLAAVHLALKELETHNTDVVIAGGVDTVQNPFGYLCFSKTHALSPTGEPRVFDATADGIVMSEGIVMLVLKRLADAERDGDRIYAVIQGVGASSDGRAMGLTAPRPEGQRLALQRAYAKAGISPETVSLLEAHGTGTVVGDRTEAQVLSAFLEEARAAQRSCAIGSVKSMIGHTKATAGVAGLAKVALALHHRVLPPTLGVTQPNPKARFGQSPLYINSETRPWIHSIDDHPRRAGVSAFGFGGTNFHAVVEEYTGDFLPRQAVFERWPSELLLWPANSRQELLATLASIEEGLDQGARPELRDLAHSLHEAFNVRRSTSGACLAIVVTSLDDLRHKLAWAREGLSDPETVQITDPRGIYFAEQPLMREGKVAFLFPGQGSQYPGMLRDLTVAFPEVMETFEYADRVLVDRFSRPLSGYIFPPPAFSREEEQAQQEALTQTNVAQPALGSASLALLRLLQDLGVGPDMVAGHSYGEYVALCAAGAIDEKTLLTLSEARGRCIIESAKEDLGTMAAVRAHPDTIAPVVEPVEGVWIANLNAPEQTIISGTRDGIAEAVKRLQVDGISAQSIPVACAFHSPLMAPAQQRLAEVLSGAEFAVPSLEVFSNTTGKPYPRKRREIRELLAQHLVRPIQFTAEIEAMHAAGARLFVEVGPRNVLASLASQTLGERPHAAIPVDLPSRSGLTQLQHALGQLAAHGVPLHLGRLFRDRTIQRLDLDRLVEETAERPLPATTWLVNGRRARPIHKSEGPPSPPVRLAPVQAQASTDRGVPTSPTAQEQDSVRLVETFSPDAPSTPATVHSGSAALAPMLSSGHEQEMIQFQRLMDRFLETQRQVMLAYLRGTPAVATAAQLGEPAPAIRPADVASEPEPDRSMTPVAESPLEVEETQPADDAPMGADGHLDREALTVCLLSIVSERTGYPADMLDLNLDLEASLGIDSIKRVEILGRLRQSVMATGAGGDEQDLDMEQLSRLRTLREIIDRLVESDGRESALPAVPGEGKADEEALPREQPGEGDRSVADALIQRSRLRPVDQPLSTPTGGLAPGRIVLLTDDGIGAAKEIGTRLQQEGYLVVILRAPGGTSEPGPGIYEADLGSSKDIARVLAVIRQTEGSVAGLIHLLPLCPSAPSETVDLPVWRERLSLEVRSLFLLAKALREDLEAAAQTGGAVLMAASAMGGTFASDLGPDSDPFFPGQGAIAGLLKTLAKEWPAVRVKAVDLDRREEAGTLAEYLLTEFMADDGQVEVGYRDTRRIVLEPVSSPLLEETNLAIGTDWVLLVTGGARGITSDVALELAERYRPTLVLVGRSSLPDPEEAPDTIGLTEPSELKAALIARQQAQGQPVALAEIEQAYERLLKDREMRSNLAAMTQAGARVHYHSVDVRDEQAFGALIDDVYQSFGRLDGVIHGAGVIEDKLVTDKSVASFDRVFGTKVESAFILSRRLRPESLRFLIFFSSVAGRFGNRGQADYGAANEVLNKLAIDLDRQWPSRVVSLIWGAWKKRGMVSPELERQFALRDIVLIPPAAGRRWLAEEIRRGRKGEAEVLIAGGTGDLSDTRAGEHPASLRTGDDRGSGGEGTVQAPRRCNGISQSETTGRPLLEIVTPTRKSSDIELVYELDPARDLLLNDHRLNGKPVLPAAEAIELMAETVAWGWPDLEILRLRDIRVQRGVIVTAPEAVRIAARPSEQSLADDGGAVVHVEITDTSPAQKPHYRATVELGKHLPPPPRYQATYVSPLQPFTETVSQAYSRYLFHGPMLHCIAEIEGINREGILARVTPSSPQAYLAWQPRGSWLIDPVVIDGGFQLAIVWARIRHGITPLPSRFQAYHRYGSLTGSEIRCYLYSEADPDSLIMHTNLFFVTPDGQVMGMFEGAESTCSTRVLGRPVSGLSG